jgi:hypothetical protein
MAEPLCECATTEASVTLTWAPDTCARCFRKLPPPPLPPKSEVLRAALAGERITELGGLKVPPMVASALAAGLHGGAPPPPGPGKPPKRHEVVRATCCDKAKGDPSGKGFDVCVQNHRFNEGPWDGWELDNDGSCSGPIFFCPFCGTKLPEIT